MTNLRLVLTIALPSVTALIGILYFLGRKRGKGKDGEAATKGDNQEGESVERRGEIGGGDDLMQHNENHLSFKSLTTDQSGQCRRRERDKPSEPTVNGQKPVNKETQSIQNETHDLCSSSREKIPETDIVKDHKTPMDLPLVTQKAETEFESAQAWVEDRPEHCVEDEPNMTYMSVLKNVDVSKSSSSSKPSAGDGTHSAVSDTQEVVTPRSVTILTRSPGHRSTSNTVHTSEQVLSASRSLAKPSERSQEGVGAKTSNHDITTSVLSSSVSPADPVSASEASPVSKSDQNSASLEKSDQIAASKSQSLESIGCDARPSISVGSNASSNTTDSSASVVIEVSSNSDVSSADLVSHEKTISDSKTDQGTSAITSEESSKQGDSPSAASENTPLLMDNSNKMAATSVAADAVQCPDRMSDQNGSAAVAGSSESPGCDSNSEASNDSGRGGSVTEPLPLPVMAPDTARYEFNFPSELCGRLIGKNGRNINLVKEKSGANIALKNNPCTPNFQICVIEGTQSEIDKALAQIRKKFPRGQFPQVDFSPLTQVVQEAPVLMPDIMQLNLPEGVSVDIVVSNIVDAGHIFVQQPTHPTFPSLERLNHFMMACYTQDHMVPPLPRPIEVGVICAAFMVDGWFRAQVVNVSENTDEVDIKYVDYGGYARLQASMLKQIRSDFMTLPFQAVECYMGNITPLQEEEYFSTEGSTVLEELTQGKLLQAQVVNRAEDGIPYIHIYQISGNRVLFINREMVNRKCVRWIEILQ